MLAVMVHTGRAAAGRRIVAPIWLVHSQRNTKNPLTIPLNDRSTTAAQEDLRVCWCLLLITDETGCCIFLERLFREHDVVLARRLLIPVINKIVTTTANATTRASTTAGSTSSHGCMTNYSNQAWQCDSLPRNRKHQSTPDRWRQPNRCWKVSHKVNLVSLNIV